MSVMCSHPRQVFCPDGLPAGSLAAKANVFPCAVVGCSNGTGKYSGPEHTFNFLHFDGDAGKVITFARSPDGLSWVPVHPSWPTETL